MRKITSILLILTMLLCIFAVNASAAGILVQSDFSDMESFTQHLHAGAFYTDGGLLFGYDEAKCLQTKNEWFVYDTSIKVAFADDELSENARGFSVVYPNTNLYNYGRAEGTYYMSFTYDIETKSFWLSGGGVGLDKDQLLADPIPYEGIVDDGSKFYTFGMSVTRGRIRCFLDNELIYDFVDSNDEYLIGVEDESTVPTALVFWNDGNFLQIEDVKVATPEFLYPPMPAGDDTQTTATQDGTGNGADTDNNTAAPTQPVATTTSVKVVEKTDDSGNVMTDASGNKVTEIVIVTDPPVADTNPGASVGGNSTSTGDKAIMVVSAMVVTIGCAIIVKKVNIG